MVTEWVITGAKKDRTGETQLCIQNYPLPMYERDQAYTYLGYSVNISNTANTTQTADVVRQFRATLDKIDVAPLPVTAKLQAINVMCCSRLNFYFPNLTFTVQQLKEMEDEIVSCVRTWLKLNNSSTRSFMFCPRSEGGLGIQNPFVMYYAKHISFKLSVLNNDDAQVRETARCSLSLHMQKRRATCSTPSDPCSFAGYKTTPEGRVIKNSKVDWSRSDWLRLCEMCAREGIEVKQQCDGSYVASVEGIDGATINTPCHQTFYKVYKQKKK